LKLVEKLASFLLRDAYRGVFVVLRDENESDEKYQTGLDICERLFPNSGLIDSLNGMPETSIV
jgi:hypothetical protein